MSKFFNTEIVFNPLLSDINEIKEFLSSFSKKVAHPIEGGYIIFDGVDYEIVKSELLISDFMQASAIGQLEETQFELFKRHRETAEFDDYSVNILFPGSVGCVPVTDKFQICSVTNKSSGKYFDLQAHHCGRTNRDLCCLSYSVRRSESLEHSGDIGALLHTIHSSKTSKTFVVSVVGYGRQQLASFVSQTPIVVVADHENRVLNIIPIPLDHATIGDASFAAILQCRYVIVDEKLVLEFKVLEQIPTLSGVDTGDSSLRVGDSISHLLFEPFPNVYSVATEPACAVSDDFVAEKQISDGQGLNAKYDSLSVAPNCIEFMQFPYPTLISDALVMPFGRGIGSFDNECIALPCLTGEILRGHKSVLIGTPYCGPMHPSQYIDIVNSSHIIVHVCISGWYSNATNTGKSVMNCLFVAHLTDEEMENLSSVQMNFLAIVGPRATVIVENREKFYFYRGISRIGIPRANFGEEVFPNFAEYAGTLHEFLVFSNKNDMSIYSQSHREMLNSDELVEKISEINDHDLIIDILVQCTVCCNSKFIAKLASTVLSFIKNRQDLEISSARKLFCFDESIENWDKSELSRRVVEFRSIRNKIVSNYKDLVAFISSNMISVNGCVSGNQSIERVKRRGDIKINVDDAINMSVDDLIAEQVIECEKHGVLVCSFDSQPILGMMRLLSDDHVGKEGSFYTPSKFIASIYDSTMESLLLNPRCPQLDVDTYRSISEVTVDTVKAFSGSGSITLPIIAERVDGQMGSLIVPMYECLLDAEPYSPWNDIANHKAIAHFRIRLRNTLVGATCSRDLIIPPISTGLGAMLCLLFLGLLEKMIEPLSLDCQLEADDSTSIRIRATLGFVLTLMASGNIAQLSAWELFRPLNCKTPLSIPDSIETYDVYVRLLKVARFSGWNLSVAMKRFEQVSKKFLEKHPECIV